MSFQSILMLIMAIGLLAGGVDLILGDHLGLGTRFKDGLQAFGPLVLGMVGILCLAPDISMILRPLAAPFCHLFGIDPAFFASLIACDMGGYPLAMELADSPEMGKYFGILVCSMLGCTVSFTIPVGLNLVKDEDRDFFSKGLLIGLITVPFSSFAGGIAAGFPLTQMLINTLPVLFLAVVLSVCLSLIPEKIIRGCYYFGRVIMLLCIIGLAAAAFESLTGIVLIPGLVPIEEAMQSVVSIVIVLMGALPTLEIAMRLLKKPLLFLGSRLGIGSNAMAGLIMQLANAVPVMTDLGNMDTHGKVLNMAVIVSCSCVIGDHFAYTIAVCPEMTVPLIVGKLAGGILAILITLTVFRD